ncbi:uncharacterized protein CCOS01_08431 [Colletotrichum costaricense]|uniref:NAD-specific glutamate dehydrogenase n=1 Tax=Colletotrichum costaricense TaxID=1209916 RepID=A0AAJ0DZM3_9PEZI|nr:uncharacterized protein CCOS01_08431 [Colletotrichum costaricense]KAK1526013.1 hypothetical protein CCOS01_08431 [Colletotrichum costaricense]
MPNQEPVRAAREPSVRQQRHVLAQPGAHDGGAGLQHLGHAGAALGPFVADDDDRLLALLDLAALQGGDEAVLLVEDARLAREDEALLAGDLAHGAAGRELAAQDLDVARRLDGVAEGADDGLVLGEVGRAGDVLLHRLARDGDAGAVDEAFLEEELEQAGGAADAVHVGHDVLSRRLQVSQEGRAVRDGLEVVDGELDADGVGDGEQVEDGVGAASEDVDDDHGVLKGLAGHDIARANVLLEEVLDSRANVLALGLLGGILGGAAGAVRHRQAERLDGGGHCVRGVHATAGAGAGAGVADDVEALLLRDLAGDVLAVGLESGNDINGLAALAAAGLDGAAVDHDAGAVDAAHGDGDAGHVLVAAGQGDVSVVPLAVHDGLDGVGDDLAGLEGVAHALCAHGDAVRDTNGVELVGDEAGVLDGLADEVGEVEQVHVAGVALVPDGRDADLGLVHVVLGQAGGVQHGLGGALGFGLGDVGRDLVQLLVGASGRGGGEETSVEILKLAICHSWSIGGFLRMAGKGRTPCRSSKSL